MSNVNRRSGRRVVQMTNAQLDAALTALDHVLNAADYDEQRDFFGGAATVRAAFAVQAELRLARYSQGGVMRTVRLTGIDHKLGRRVTLVEFKRVPDIRTARVLVRAVLTSGVYFELPEAEFKGKGNDGTWHRFDIHDPRKAT